MSDPIQDWQKRKAASRKGHKKLIKQLKRQKAKVLDEQAEQAHQEAFKAIDCLDCANCCTSIPPMVNRADINRISRHLGMKPAQFQDQYLTEDEDGDHVINASPCPFLLADHRCLIYDIRPRACREYPHTDGRQFAKYLHLHPVNARYCPAVFHILAQMEANLAH